MTDKGVAHIGIGHGKGDEKALDAVKQAVASPLLETTIEGASHVIINITGEVSLMEANDAASYVQDLAGDGANIIFGARFDESYNDEVTITVIATGIETYGENLPVAKAMADFRIPKQQPAGGQTGTMGGQAGVMGGQADMMGGQAGQQQQTPFGTNPTYNPTPVKAPQSTVEEKTIKIPTFLSRR